MTRKQFLAEVHQQSAQEYFADVVPRASMIASMCYPDLIEEYADCDSSLLFSSWLSENYYDLVKFIRSLSLAEKLDLVLSCCEE